MNGSFNFVIIAFLLGSTQGLFLALLLINKPGNKVANRILATLILAYSLFIAETSLSATHIVQQFPHIIGLTVAVVFLFGPLHYLYALSLISINFSFSKKHLLHFIPFVVCVLGFVPFYIKSGPDKLAFVQMIDTSGPPVGILIRSWAILFQFIIYMIATLFILKRHSISIRDSFSSIDKIQLYWLRNITLMTMVIGIIGLAVEIYQVFDYDTSFTYSVPLAIAVLIYAMGYLGLKQPEIFDKNVKMKDIKKYERSGLTKEKGQQLLEKLKSIMEIQKPFTDSNLKLAELAQMVSTTPNYLSQVINEERQQNFFDFINWYRIEEAKKMIKDNANQQSTLLSIAYDVGFNSKSAFNTAFKKHTQKTPSQLRDNLS